MHPLGSGTQNGIKKGRSFPRPFFFANIAAHLPLWLIWLLYLAAFFAAFASFAAFCASFTAALSASEILVPPD